MDGIQALMPQGQPQGQPPQMPGQAPGQMPGMQPQQGGPAPGINSQAPMLEKLGLDQLKQLYMQSMMPGSGIPVQPFAILSVISKKAEQEEAIQAVENAIAMGQNAQQQGMGSVAQQVLQKADQFRKPVMAAHGGVMRGYAGGGIVAFADGDAVWKKRLVSLGVPTDFIANLEARKATPEQIETEARRAGLIPAQTSPVAPQPEVKKSFIDRVLAQHAESPVSQAVFGAIARAAKGESAGPLLERPVIETLASQTTPPPPRVPTFPGKSGEPDTDIGAVAPAKQISERLKDTRGIPTLVTSSAERPPAPAPTAAPAAAATTTPFSGIASLAAKPDPELEAAFQRKEAAAGISAADLADLKAKQAAEIAARTAAETGRSQRAEEMRARATQAYQEALTGQEGIFGPRGLFEIAAAIDPRRGQIMGSLARGATGVLAREEKAKKEARTEYERVQQLYSQELNALDALRVATKERDTAIASANIEAARAAEDRRAQIQIDYNKLKEERTQAQRNLALEVAKAEQTAAYQKTMGEAATKQARAAETTAGKPAAEIQLMQWLSQPENKKLYEEIQASKRDDDRRLKLFELYTKNELQLADKYPTFESFAAAFNQATGKSSVPPPGAVREKGK